MRKRRVKKPEKPKKLKIVAVVGPTASGKSDLAVYLARTFGGEVISADSRQVYRGLDIGTGKITKREMRGVPHHLLDVADPRRAPYTAANFVRDAEKSLRYIVRIGKLPIICGGTGFYIDALLGGISLPSVPPDKALRTKLETKSAAKLFTELKQLDPHRAAAIDPRNKRRLIRALEIVKTLGRVPRGKNKSRYDVLWIGLAVPRDVLRKKITKRLKERLKRGMIAEAKKLHSGGLSFARMRSLGLEYRHLADYLEKKISRTELFTHIERDNGRYAKRQMTWFKRNPGIRWFSPAERGRIKRTVSALLKR